MTQDQLRDLSAEWRRWRDDPVRFNAVALGRPPYWSRQVEICKSVVDYRVTVVYSGNAVGKSYLLAGILAWWLYTRPGSLVICTAASQTSIGSILWKELRKAIGSSMLPQPRISAGIKTSPAVLEIAPGWHGLGYATTTIERASGQHAEELLVVCDEASAIETDIFDALESLKYTRMLCMGNPIRGDGEFVSLIHQAAADKRDNVPPHKAVNAIQIASTESPHATWDKSPFGLADRTWIDACYRRYGKESLWVRSHILALIPTLANERLIPDADIDRCIANETEALITALRAAGKGGKRRMGCDVGEGCGNSRTVIPVRDDLGVLEIHASRFTGPVAAAEWVARLQAKWQVKEADCSYDGAGQTGKRMGNALYRYGLRGARPYFGAESGGKRCTNLRTATALALARRLDPGHYAPGGPYVPFHIPASEHWPAIREEMQELRYTLSGDKSKLEDKDSLMERLGRSPDFIDALCQTWKEEAIDG